MNLVEMERDTIQNNRAARHIEVSLLSFSRRGNIYTVFEDTPEYFEWIKADIREFDKDRKKGMYIEDLAFKYGRCTEEIAMAIFDREVLGKKIRVEKDDLEGLEGEYILFDNDPDYCIWHLKDVLLFDEAYKQKKSIQTLSEMFKRTQEEIALLIFDRAIKNKI